MKKILLSMSLLAIASTSSLVIAQSTSGAQQPVDANVTAATNAQVPAMPAAAPTAGSLAQTKNAMESAPAVAPQADQAMSTTPSAVHNHATMASPAAPAADASTNTAAKVENAPVQEKAPQ